MKPNNASASDHTPSLERPQPALSLPSGLPGSSSLPARPAASSPNPNADPACPSCHGQGFVWVTDHPRYPNGAYAPCPCVARARRRCQLAALMARSGLDEDTIRRWSFDTFDPSAALASPADRATLARVKAHCQAYAHDPQGWLVLSGPYGCGKSHLAYATAAAFCRTGRPLYVSSVPDLLQTLREGFSKETEFLGRNSVSSPRTALSAPSSPLSFGARLDLLRDVDLLVLDDLGAEQPTPWALEKLYQIIDYRHRRRLPLLVTTNVNLYAPAGPIEPRVRSRLLDGANTPHGFSRVFLLNARDYRQRPPTTLPLPPNERGP